MRRRNSKGKLIAFLCMALVFMGVGFAAIQTRLSITGSSRAVGSFNVEIVDASPEENTWRISVCRRSLSLRS